MNFKIEFRNLYEVKFKYKTETKPWIKVYKTKMKSLKKWVAKQIHNFVSEINSQEKWNEKSIKKWEFKNQKRIETEE